jgi:hypothetical protein
MKLAAAFFLTLAAFAQTPEIRGTVVEQGPNSPLARAEVSLYEFLRTGDNLDERLYRTIYTDDRGAFSFKPTHLGDYRLEVRKPGYFSNGDSFDRYQSGTYKLQLHVTETNQTQTLRVVLLVPSSLTGRVVDEDRKPVANFTVFVQVANALAMLGGGTPAVTDADGIFTATKLVPGAYIVRVQSVSTLGLTMSDFSERESKLVDEGIATAYWPGGVAEPNAALAIPVPPGASANAGTIVLRKALYYRASVQISGECSAGESWNYALIKLPQQLGLGGGRSTVPCRKQFLLRNLAPGSYTLAVFAGNEGSIRFASAPITIGRENVEAKLTMFPGTEIAGRFTAADGIPLPNFKATRVQLLADSAPANTVGGPWIPAADGTLAARTLPWSRYTISISGIPPSHYVKEVRYGHLPITDGTLTLAPGAPLEIVLDDHPAAIRGTVKGATARSVVLLDRRTQTPPGNFQIIEPYTYSASAKPAGTFEFLGLAPGEYRIRLLGDSSEWQRITLDAGDRKTIELKPK